MTFKYFFTPKDLVPSGTMSWEMYGKEHIIILLCMVVFLCFMCKIYKNFNEEKREKFVKFFAYMIFVQEILKDIIFFLMGVLNYEHLPFHLCGLAIFITLFYAITNSELGKQMLYALVLPGALAALIFPNWVEYPLIHISPFNSFTIHLWLIVVPIVSLYTRELVPNFRYLWKCFLFLVCVGIPNYFLNKMWGTNFMFVSTPSEGSPLMFIADIFGNKFYILGMCIALFIVWAIMYSPFIYKELKEKSHANA